MHTYMHDICLFFHGFGWIPQRKGERKDVVYHVIQYNHMCTPMFFAILFVYNILDTYSTFVLLLIRNMCIRCFSEKIVPTSISLMIESNVNATSDRPIENRWLMGRITRYLLAFISTCIWRLKRICQIFETRKGCMIIGELMLFVMVVPYAIVMYNACVCVYVHLFMRFHIRFYTHVKQGVQTHILF